MDQSAFYGVVSAINFTLLGLWWVAVKGRTDLLGDSAVSHRTAYLVSLQFVIPATVSLLAQVAPDEKAVWRSSFVVAGVVGAVSIAMLSQEIRVSSSARVAPLLFAVLGIPLYVLTVVVALAPDLVADVGMSLKPIETEGLLVSMLVFLGVQEAWVVSMTPPREPVAQTV
jgi:cytochrome bd-type quinol oxidase subunit 2